MFIQRSRIRFHWPAVNTVFALKLNHICLALCFRIAKLLLDSARIILGWVPSRHCNNLAENNIFWFCQLPRRSKLFQITKSFYPSVIEKFKWNLQLERLSWDRKIFFFPVIRRRLFFTFICMPWTSQCEWHSLKFGWTECSFRRPHIYGTAFSQFHRCYSIRCEIFLFFMKVRLGTKSRGCWGIQKIKI